MHQSFGNARIAVEQTDWHDEAERIFVDSLAGRLDMAIAVGETSDLIIIAAQRALGMLSRNRFGRLPAARRTKCYGACTDARTCSLPTVSLPQLLEYPTQHSGRRCKKVPS